MGLHSNFESDLNKEQKLSLLLDVYYKKHLKFYAFERISNVNQQMAGIDIILTHTTTKKQFLVDEKAQLDYVNEDLPTFAFELSYLKNDVQKKGWLFDCHKKTHFYALITSIYSDEPQRYTSCNITFVNREKLLQFLKMKGINENLLASYINNPKNIYGKVKLPALNHRTEGYLYFSTKNKAEKPINLILKLDFLIKIGVAKRFI